ncbi:MAG: serine hydrolase, partial [Verrucomicrobiales bacterium]|nr:serine hydrolase [Verrucomicrobiales bacterium]
MNVGLGLVLLGVAVFGVVAEAEDLPRSMPEVEGVSSAGLMRLVERLDREGGGVHSLMVVRHGKVIAEGWWAPYAAESNHVLYSLSKSFASTAVGLVVAEGKVGLFDRVVDLFPDDVPGEVGGNLRGMRVRDLLTMATGHQTQPPTAPDEVSVKSFLAHPVEHQPGTHFMYNTPATFVQAAIVEKVSGERLVDYLRPRLFAPLGIEKPEWETNFEGIALGGYGLRVRTEDIVKLGQLYLQRGVWEGKRLLSEDWVAMATSRMMANGSDPENDWAQGYGFQFWRCRHGAYRGDGAFGQYCVVMPEQDMVVAITSGLKDMGGILRILWEELLPAVNGGALEGDAEGVALLGKVLGGLEVPVAEGNADGGASGKRYVFEENELGVESVVVEKGERGIDFVVVAGGKESRVRCGHGEWIAGRAVLDGGRLASFGEEAVAGSYGWSGDVLEVKVCAVETPFVVTWRFGFSGDE